MPYSKQVHVALTNMGTVRLAKQIPALSLIKGNLSGVFTVNFKHILQLALVFLLLNHVISRLGGPCQKSITELFTIIDNG